MRQNFKRHSIQTYKLQNFNQSVAYAIYGTWYHIHAHKVTQLYMGLINSTRKSFYLVLIAFAQGSVINYSLFIVSDVSHLGHLLPEDSKICTPTSDISVLPETIQRVPELVLK